MWSEHKVDLTKFSIQLGRVWFGVNTKSLMITPKLVLHKNETNYRC